MGIGKAVPPFTGERAKSGCKEKGSDRGRRRLCQQQLPRAASNSCLCEGQQPPAFPRLGFRQEKRARSCRALGETPSGSSSGAPASRGGDGSWSSHAALSVGFAECPGACWLQAFPPQISAWRCLESGKMTCCHVLLHSGVGSSRKGDSRRVHEKCCISAFKQSRFSHCV